MSRTITTLRRHWAHGFAAAAALLSFAAPLAAETTAATTITTAPAATPAVPGVVEDEAFLAKLNQPQRVVHDWTYRQFRRFFDFRTFPDLTAEERAKFEAKQIDTLRGPITPEYYAAINTLAALRSETAVPALLAIAADRAEKDNRDRWMAVRALGLIGDKSVVPEFIHLTYYPNMNTRFWAQISLVRLTGQNFGTDWQAWGKWWNEQDGRPAFVPAKIMWSSNPEYMDEAKQKEADAKWVEELQTGKKPE